MMRLAAVMMLLLPALHCRPEEPSRPTAPADSRRQDEPGDTTSATDDAIEDVADTGERARAEAPPPRPVASRITVSADPSAPLKLEGLPGISADGMHVALLSGDRETGPLTLQIARIDGSILLEHPLLERADFRELATDPVEKKKLRRGLARRVAPAQRVLTRADMRALGAAPLDGAEAPLSLDDGVITASLPGFARTVVPLLTETPCTAPEVRASYADREHGVVVAEIALTRVAELCPDDKDLGVGEPSAHRWRIFALTPLR